MNLRTNFALALAVLASLAVASDGRTERHVITAHITVEEGDTLRFAPGAEVLFGDLAGITVKGRLEAIGTKSQPIKIASVNDTAGAASPFDWNGIEVVGVGHAALSNVHVSGAISGIISERPRGLTLENCVFDNNGQWHLSIAGEVQDVSDGEPYNYSSSAAAFAPVKASADITIDTSIDTSKYSTGISAEETLAADTERKAKKKSSPVKLTLRISAAALAVGGIAGAIYYDGKVKERQDKYKNAKTEPDAADARAKLERAEEKYVPYRNALYAAGAVGLAGFTITFLF